MDLTAAASPSIPRPTPPSTTRNNEARDAIEVDRIYLRNNLRLYIREAWHVVEPSTVYLENWHIDLIAEYLEAVTAAQIKRLLINKPPRYAKSTCVSIMWPTWVWAREPFPGKPYHPALEESGTKWVFASSCTRWVFASSQIRYNARRVISCKTFVVMSHSAVYRRFRATVRHPRAHAR